MLSLSTHPGPFFLTMDIPRIASVCWAMDMFALNLSKRPQVCHLYNILLAAGPIFNGEIWEYGNNAITPDDD